MKTFDEILLEIMENDYRNQDETKESPETRAAKEYAKQWVKEANQTYVEYYLNLIDEQ